MKWYEVIGWMATIFSICVYCPQSYKVIKNRSADLSKITFTVVVFGVSMWSVYTPLVESMQGFITNSIMILLMIPIIWFLYNRNLKIIIPIYLFMILAIGLGIFFNINKMHINTFIKYPLVILAGSSTGFSFLPQAIKIVRERAIKDYSILSGIITIIGSSLWVTYWLGKTIASATDDIGLGILSIIFSSFGVVWQIPILTIYIKNRINANN